MKHRRSPTHSYARNNDPLATLALRHPQPSIPTLLSPLRPIANTPLHDAGDTFDDFQSNAWVNAPLYRPLTGLGITYLRDASASPHVQSFEDSTFQMQIDGGDELLLWPADTGGTSVPRDGFLTPTDPYRAFESEENRHVAQCASDICFSLCDSPTIHPGLGLDSSAVPAASEAIGLIPDVNMYDKLRQLDLPHPSVNPLDTICGTPLHDMETCYEEPASIALKDPRNNNILSTTDLMAGQSPSPRVIQDIMSILVKPTPESSFLPRSSTNSTSVQAFSLSQVAAPGTSASHKPELTSVPYGERHASCKLEYPDATHSSPILNAHLGIELDELISRAECFKVQYPERDIDRAWLSHFAGKLSDRGELLNDFRCYVVGCDQRNKRRDHILVHVGAHIGQRPFACSVCPLRFLRKNECKRHEASHSGSRPYSCDICGQSFVRQDLVKRHVKRTHSMRDENEPEVENQPSRKRARLR